MSGGASAATVAGTVAAASADAAATAAAASSFTLADAGLAASLVSASVGALGAVQQGQATANADKYNAEIAANNAKIATQNANYAGAAGNAQAEQASLATRAKVGGIIANQAAGNIDVTKGSALDVRSSAQQLGELNALTIKSNAARQAYGYQTEAASSTAQSQLDTTAASNATTSSELNAGTTVIGGAGSAASNYANFTKNGGNGFFNSVFS